jgi:hypothetical protein
MMHVNLPPWALSMINLILIIEYKLIQPQTLHESKAPWTQEQNT